MTQSFMVVKENSCIDFELEMLRQNRIYRLLNLDIIRRDSKMEYWYDITGLQSIQDYLGNQKMDYKLFRILYFSIYKILLEVQKYLLEQEKVCLDFDKIYIDAQSDKIYVCYFPFPMVSQMDAFLKFMENVLAVLDHRDSYAVEKIYHIYEIARQGTYDMGKICEDLLQERAHEESKVQSNEITLYGKSEVSKIEQIPEVQIESFKEDKEKNQKNRIAKQAEEKSKPEKKEFFLLTLFYKLCEKIEQNIELPKTAARLETKKEQNKTYKEKKRESIVTRRKNQKEKDKQEEITFSFDPNEDTNITNPTVLLTKSNQIIGELKYIGNQKELDHPITTTPFFIGNKAEAVHAFLTSKTVSKVHAKIYKKEEFFYIEDLNSKNGTKVDEILIPCNTPYVLKKHVKIEFADVLYEFI